MGVGGGLAGVVRWGERLGRKLVPDGLGEIVEPLVPPQRQRPQGGGTRYVDHRAVLTAIVDVLRAGGAGPPLPAQLGGSPATAHRRFTACTEVGGVAATAPGSP